MYALGKLPDGVAAPPPPPPLPPTPPVPQNLPSTSRKPSSPWDGASTSAFGRGRDGDGDHDDHDDDDHDDDDEDDDVDIGGAGYGDDDDDDGGGGGLSDLNEDLLDRDDIRDIRGAMGTYSHKRNMDSKGEFGDDFQSPKPVLEFVNIKYVEDNFRSIGITRRFPRNSLLEAYAEIHALENWSFNKRCTISKKEYIRKLCIPLFCHLYLSIYNQNKPEEMISFLKRFAHLFSGSSGSKIMKELENITDLKHLPSTLDVLSKNKIMYSCTPQFLTSFCKLLHRNYMLKAVFQEFFEIQFDSCENAFEVVDSYIVKHLQILKNKLMVNDREYNSQKKNISDASNNNLSSKKPNSSQKNDHSVVDTTSIDNNDQHPSTSRDYQKCNNQEPQPSKDQPKVINLNILSSDSENEKPQREHRIFEKTDVDKNLDDPQPSTSREFQNSQPQLSKQEPKVINILSSDSEGEIVLRNNQLIKEPEDNEGLDGQQPSTNNEFQDSQQRPQLNKNQPKVINLLSSESESEMFQKKLELVDKSKVDKSLDDLCPSTSKNFQTCHRQESSSNDQSKVTNIILLSSTDSENEKKMSTQSKRRRIKKSIADTVDESSDSSSEDSERKSRRSKKNYVKRKHSSRERDRSSSYEQESRNKKKQRREEHDLNEQNGSIENVHEREIQSSNPQINERYSILSSKPSRISFVYKGTNLQDNEYQESEHVNQKNENEKKDINNGKVPHTWQNNHNLKDKKLTYPFKSSFEDSSEDSSGDSFCSRYSGFDDEATLRSYYRERNQSHEYLQNKTSRLLKHTNVTKIDVKNNDEDLCSTRQITITNCNKLSCTMLSSDHKYVAAGSMDSIIYVWERTNLSYVLDVQNNIENNTQTISQNEDLVELLDKSEAKILRGHGGSIFDLAEIASAKILLSASHDKTFRAWDLRTKICLEVYNEHEHRTWCIAACPFTLQVITGSCEGASCLWFLKYKRPLRFFVGHIDDVLVVKFHPNQALIATGSSDKTIRIFEVTSGECLRLLLGHTDYITCLEFHPTQSNFLASASGNGEIMMWNIGRSTLIWKLRVDNMLVSDIAWYTEKIILASLTSGIILKCDTREDYMESTKSVKGYTTKFDRLMALKIYDSIVYTIGVPSKTSIPKTFSAKQPTYENNNEITNVLHKVGKNNPTTMSANFHHLQLQNNVQLASNIQQQQQQQVSQLQSVIQPRITTQLFQKSSLLSEQQLQLQQSVGNNFQLTNTNMQQPIFQQLRPNTHLTKVNVQQLQTRLLTNINTSQPRNNQEPRTSSQVLAIKNQKSMTNQPSLENTEEDVRLRQVVMASLLENNPEIFSRGQTVIGEITRSLSTTQSLNTFNTIAATSLTEPQQNENH